ncbi:hypothetical protein M0805_000789 [Coniferiporia weirii]|nr:hypothetical protein M0805_000789 [Coniferiporia weirii]
MWKFLTAFIFASISVANAASDCTGTISSLDDVSDAEECTTININAFTVPAGETFKLEVSSGTTVNLNGDVLFGNESWAGPLFEIEGDSVTFNGNGYIMDGGGPFYWDGLGTDGGVTKPHPMLKIEISGTFSDLKVVNSPAQAFSVSNPAALVISNVEVDNSQGDAANANSDGLPAGHNTDGFDVSTDDLTIQDSTVKNQDDCLAINKGTNIVFTGNTCSGGHGISIGSITSDVTVSGIVISDNTITNSQQGLRIKMDASATGSTVSNITYSGNTGSGLTEYGVLITQSYPDSVGTPGTGVILSDVSFTGSKTTLDVDSTATNVVVNCGEDACTGTWDWDDLDVSGGETSLFVNFDGVSGGTY